MWSVPLFLFLRWICLSVHAWLCGYLSCFFFLILCTIRTGTRFSSISFRSFYKTLSKIWGTWSCGKCCGLSNLTKKTFREVLEKYSSGHRGELEGQPCKPTVQPTLREPVISCLEPGASGRMLSWPRSASPEAPILPNWCRRRQRASSSEKKGHCVCQCLNSVYSVNTRRSSTFYCSWFCNLHKINICLQKQPLR